MIRPVRDLLQRPLSAEQAVGSKDEAERTQGRQSCSKRRVVLSRRVRSAGKQLCLVLVNLALFAMVYWLAFVLRFDFRIPSEWMLLLVMTAPFVIGLKLAVFYAIGQQHSWWSHVTFADLVALVRAAVLSLGVVAMIDYFVFPKQIPRAVLLLDCMMTIVLFGAVWASGRVFVEHVWPTLWQKRFSSALLIGEDRSTGLLAHQINSYAELGYRIRGFLATNGRKPSKRLGQIPVVGDLSDVREIAGVRHIKDVFVVAGSLPGRRMRWLMDVCEESSLRLKIIPPVEDLFGGSRLIPLRDLKIDDLLARSPTELDCDAIGELLQYRRVLVTGAGGSIGSEICRQVLKFKPAELVLLGRGENRIFFVEHELRAQKTPTTLRPVIANITDVDRMRQVFEQYRPDVVLHAAAHKHVPLMEANVGESINNNVLGTKCLADLANEYGVKNLVLISSDKAVNPSSVMGATKHLAERYVQALSCESSTRFGVVRFGNVLGSAGSVVPIFQEQIRRGGPITVTDPEMTRYFMTIPEAAQLVLQAAAMGRGGEIFVLDMGQPVRIADLARDLIRLSGLPPSAIDITYTGIRPGEKLTEELYLDDEHATATAHDKIRLAEPRTNGIDEVARVIKQLEHAMGEPDEVLRAKLSEAIPEYQPPGYAIARDMALCTK